jgi:hypothetical protein
MTMDKYEFQELASKTSYLVEADDFAALCLWKEHCEEGAPPYDRSNQPRVVWKEECNVGYQIGRIDNRPIMLMMRWATLGKHLVCFFDSPSELVDHKMIDEYLRKTFPGVRKCAARNFRLALNFLRDEAGEPPTFSPLRALGQEAVEQFRESGFLSTHMIESSERALQEDEDGAAEVHGVVQQLNHLARRFRVNLWLGGLKEKFNELPLASARSSADGLEMLVAASAGRVMMTLRETKAPEGAFVSLLGYSGAEEGMYLRGCAGDHPTLTKLLVTAIENGGSLCNNLQADPEVQLSV